MKKFHYLGFGVGGIVVIGMVAFLLLSTQGGEVENADKIAEQSGVDQEVYPLYGGVGWGEVVAEGEKVKIVSEPFVDVTNIAAVTTPFAEYYHQKLTAAGWTRDMMREASGPGSNISYYTKDDRFITIAYESDFKVRPQDAPFECPCDVRFSITSGAE